MKSITVFGDSISVGQHVSVHRSWPCMMAARMGDRALVQNRSVSGNTTRMALERMPYDIQSDPPDILLVQFGQNDANCWQTDNGLTRVSVDAFFDNLLEIVARARTFGSTPFLLTNPPAAKGALLPAGNQRYNRIIREAAEDAACMLIDIEPVFAGQMYMILPDGVHLSADGHRVYCNVICAALEEYV